MIRRNPDKLLVCLVFLLTVFAVDAQAWDYRQAALVTGQEDLPSPPTASTPAAPAKPIQKVKVKEIVKCRPPAGAYAEGILPYGLFSDCVLPLTRPQGWQLDAEAFFARTKGKGRLLRGPAGFAQFGTDDVDMNADMGLPEHSVVGTFSATYRFRPQWAARYSVMPFALEGSTQSSRNFTWGTTNQGFGSTRAKWERLYQRIGLVYDPIRTHSTRVSVFGDYVRLNEKVTVIQTSLTGGDSLDNDLNMGMAGLEFEKCLKTSRRCNTLSLECRAGIAFGDEAFGSDLSTGLKYSIPMNNGRWGFIKGGYRYLTFKKKYSDVRMIDTAMEGGFLQMGVVF
jgi:hypothetical protein